MRLLAVTIKNPAAFLGMKAAGFFISMTVTDLVYPLLEACPDVPDEAITLYVRV